MNLGDIFNALTGGVKQPGAPAGSSGAYAAGDRYYRGMDEIRNMVPGQTVQGEVVGKDGNTVQIALDSETILSARLEHDLNIALGQSMSFEVKSNNGSLLSLVPLYANMANEATIMRALSAAGLSATAENMKMVSDMMQEGLSIDKDSIAYVNRQLVDYPDADPGAIVQMIRLGMPISAESIEQFSLYMNYEHQILQSAEQIMEEIPQTYLELLAEGKDAEAQVFYEQIIKALIGDAAEGMDEASMLQNAANEAEADGTVIVKEAADGLTNEVNGESDAIAGQTDGTTGTIAGQSADMLQNEALDDALKAGTQESEINNASSQNGQGETANGVLNEAAVKEPAAKYEISQAAWRELGDMMQKLGTDAELAKQIADGKFSAKEVLSQLNEMIASHSNLINDSFHESLKGLFGSRAFQNLLQAQMSNEWLLKPEEVAYKENVERLYERLKEQTTKINEAFQMAGKEDSAGAKSVNNLQNNVDFMNQINHLFTYIQLPLKMAGNEAHGDLYVYTNKKSLAKKDGNVSALLHLDMENLGPVDVYVTMNTSHNKVNTNFTLKDEAALDLIATNIHILDERLEKRGYSMKANFQLKDETEPEETNIMQEILKQSKNISVLSRTSFDMRA